MCLSTERSVRKIICAVSAPTCLFDFPEQAGVFDFQILPPVKIISVIPGFAPRAEILPFSSLILS